MGMVLINILWAFIGHMNNGLVSGFIFIFGLILFM
jgi:hypothetical protein